MTQAAHDEGQSSGGGLRTADVLGGFSLASDLAVAQVPEHGARSCYIGMHLADALGLSEDQSAALFYTELLKDAGCTAYLSQLAALWLVDELAAKRELLYFRDGTDPRVVLTWAMQYLGAGMPLPTRAGRIFDFLKNGRAALREGFESTCQMASRIAERLGMPETVQRALTGVFEQWDGKGMPDGVRGADIPVLSRIVLFTSYLDVFHRFAGRAAAERLARERRGKAFDPQLVDAFLKVAGDEEFWVGLEQERIWDRVLALEPVSSPFRYLAMERLADVAEALADYADIKAPHLVGHSRRVAAGARSVGKVMALSEPHLDDLYRAGLVYDIGMVAVPSFVLAKPFATMSESEREQYRLHAHHSRSIIGRISPFEPLLPAIGAHHERLDGRGFPSGLVAAQISLDARILAVVDRFDELTHDTPDAPAVPIERAIATIRAEAGMALAPDVVEALAVSLDDGSTQRPARQARGSWPSGLTDREVEVLRLVAIGHNRREVAQQLVLSEGTVRSHLEHIYGKIGVSKRASATLFAMEQGLLV